LGSSNFYHRQEFVTARVALLVFRRQTSLAVFAGDIDGELRLDPFGDKKTQEPIENEAD
jgi:hypothetical protein